MTANIINTSAYLRTSREFPEELHQLCVESNKSYVDVANAVNARTIGIYAANRSAITGNVYFITTLRQSSLRQIYYFTSTSPIPCGFKIGNISMIANMYGTYTDGTNIYGLIAATTVAIAGQISFYIAPAASPTSDNITFVVDGGAPALTSGIITIEWISNI